MLDFGAINWIAVVIAVVAGQVIGFLWYGPLFGKVWTAAMGRSPDDIGDPKRAIAIGILASLLAAISLALLLSLYDDPSLEVGMALGLVVGIGFAATTAVTNDVYQGQKPTVTWLSVGYQLVALVVMGAIIGAMQ